MARTGLARAALSPWLLLSAAAGGAEQARHAGDDGAYVKVREFFFHEARPDPLRQKYEELFRDPWPEEGFHQHEPFRPFADVQKLNAAFELKGAAGARVETLRGELEILLSVELPGSAGRPMTFRADDEKVVLSFPGTVAPRRYRLQREEEQVLPLPDDADPRTASVERDGDVVKVRFRRASVERAARRAAQARRD